MRAPAAGTITRGFGRQPNGTFHYGTDRGWGNGRDVGAMMAGEVVEVADRPDYGKTIRLLHGRDTKGRAIESRYCHLSRQLVEDGDTVAEGELIGVMGSTGSLAKGVHLHSELWVNGTRVNEQTFDFTIPSAPPVKQKVSQEMLSIVTRLDVTGTPTYLLTPERIYRFIDTPDLAAFQYANPAGRAPCSDKQLGLLLRQFGWTNFVSVNELADIAPGGERLRGRTSSGDNSAVLEAINAVPGKTVDLHAARLTS